MQKVHLLPWACARVQGGRRAGKGARRRARNEAQSGHCAGAVDGGWSGRAWARPGGNTTRDGEREDEGRRVSLGEGRGRELSHPIYRARRGVRGRRWERDGRLAINGIGHNFVVDDLVDGGH
jgi:hypothetical protein